MKMFEGVLSLNRALWGVVFPSLRSARIEMLEKIVRLHFFYDGEISEDDYESLEVASSEVMADFPDYDLSVEIQRLDFPTPMPEIGELVFLRKES